MDADAARELVDALGGDMMMVSNELDRALWQYSSKKQRR